AENCTGRQPFYVSSMSASAPLPCLARFTGCTTACHECAGIAARRDRHQHSLEDPDHDERCQIAKALQIGRAPCKTHWTARRLDDGPLTVDAGLYLSGPSRASKVLSMELGDVLGNPDG